MRKVIGRGYGAHGFSSVLCILRLLDKSSLMMIVLAIYNRFRQGYTIFTCLSLRVLYSLGKSGVED